jgi:cysteinyl-tRNA synthetase
MAIEHLGRHFDIHTGGVSKSTGGGVLVDDLVDHGYHPVAYRYLLLQAHYRSQIEFSWEALDSARTGLRRLLERYASARTAPPAELGAAAHRHLDAFDAAVSDDLNTAKALAVVAEASRDESLADPELSALAREFDAVLAIGLTDLSPTDLDLKRADVEVSDAHVDALMAERTAARSARDFARSDDLRNQLAHLGVAVEDHPDGTSSWRWA